MEGSASQAGFYYQNNIAAFKIIDCLFFNTDIKHIRLENYDKGNHIDDVIIYRKNIIDYYQIKWSNDGGKAYSLYNLITAEKGKKSLFKQLADGYRTVKLNNKDFTIILFSTKKESSQKRPSSGLNHGLTEIRTKIFEPLKQNQNRYDALLNYKEYQDTLEKVRTECDLDKDSFNDFIKKLEFKFSQEPTDQIQNAIKFKLNGLGIEENLFEKLLDSVVKWSISGEMITKELVLKQLGINTRFEDKLSHYFKIVDDKNYVPNIALLDKLKIAINELKGGYIFIDGLPGIGKSTALTKFKETNPDITLAYYCFIPDAKNDFGELRHKSEYFLKSLCVAIEHNFSEVDLPNKYSEKYEEKFASYIDKLGSLKKKVIFIVDGLDHVHRDIEFQEGSLLTQIKGTLPDGIFFLLSSQYKSVLSAFVLNEVDSDPRRYIKVPKFSQKEIFKYLSNKGIIVKDDVLDSIEKVSDGIPLYLHYISELLNNTEIRNYKNILNELPDLIDGKINSYHEYLFQEIDSDEFAKWVLAVLAYRKENSSAKTITLILKLAGLEGNIANVQNIINNFSHLLKQNEGRSFSIFHNSFREFILLKTRELKDNFNNALALYYEQNQDSDEAYRNYFRHLSEIGNYQKIISIVNLEWIKTAWGKFRSLSEINTNLEFALNACIEILSLSEFIRIGFLKAQVDKLSWNIEISEIDFPILLLNVGLVGNSIRSIWDGDFVLTSKEYFAYYLGKYYSKTGNLLPHKIIQQGFSKSVLEGSTDAVTIILKAQSLASSKIIEFFDDIDNIKWVKANDHGEDYLKENFSEEENVETNQEIQYEIIDYLYENKRYDHLITLSKSISVEKLLIKIKVSLVKLLLPTEKASAIKILNGIEYNKLLKEEFLKLISYSSSFLTDDEITELFKNVEIVAPNLREEIINKEGASYEIYSDVIELFEFLKPIWIFQTELINHLILKVSNLPNPAKNIYSSIFYLSELWNKDRNGILTESDKIISIKQTLNELYVKKPKEHRKVSYGLFDDIGVDHFISNSIDKLYDVIFEYSIEILTKEGVEELINYWILLEEGDDGFRHYKVALAIAKSINNSPHNNLSHLVLQIIQHAEKIARYEEDTTSLIESLINIAEIYGICGFFDQFNQIYNQLFEIAFGLGYKKDYQASYIITPLENLHKSDPEGTLKRLYEVFNIQNQLADVGRGRMHHICLSELIAYTARRYPELAFDLIVKEEKNISRSEAINIVIKPLVDCSTKKNLPLFYSIIKTLPRWDTVGSRDNHYLSLSSVLLERAIKLNDANFISDLLEDVKHIINVELEKEDELEKFSEILLKNGKDPDHYFLPIPKNKDEKTLNKKQLTNGEKFNLKYPLPNVKALIELLEKDYSKFDQLIRDKYRIRLKNRRNQTLRNEYFRSKSTFEKFYKSLSKEHQTDNVIVFKKAIRYYLEFKKKIVDLDSSEFLKSTVVKSFLNDFFSKMNGLFPDNVFQLFIEDEFELDKWIETILQFINDYSDFVFNEIVSDDSVYKIVEKVSILNIDDLITFVNKWTTGKTNAVALLKIANRIVSINPKMAKEIMVKLSDNKNDNLLFSDKYDPDTLDIDVIETFVEIDQSFGKRFLLKSFLSQKGKYSDDFIAHIDKLIKYKHYFESNNVSETYYASNLQYNRELAKGLPEKERSYEWFLHHKERLGFSRVIVKYLISLFDYPVIKIRELTLQSIFDLACENTEHLRTIFKYGIKDGSNNQIEYCLILFQSISLRNPEILLPFKKELLLISNNNHFSILESIKEIMIRLNDYKKGFLNDDEILILKNKNTISPILLINQILTIKKGRNFLYSEYQANLLRELHDNEEDNTEIQDDLYADLIKKNLHKYSPEEEFAIHRTYNINNNFDTIEINTPYHEEVRGSINNIFSTKIKKGCFDEEFVRIIKSKFRLYDPSKLLYKIKQRPFYINWVLKDSSETDFINFSDFEILTENFIKRESEYITLFEYGIQRPGNEQYENQYSCDFEIFAYLKKKGVEDSILENGNIKLTPVIREENLYANELPKDYIDSTSFPLKEIKPLLEISLNNFRGESDLSSAMLLTDVLSDFGIKNISLLDLLMEKDNYPVKAFRWQNAYASGLGRRRYKPTSEGFILKIKKVTLLNYLKENNMELCYDISLKRSVTKNRPDDHMIWYDLKKRFNARY